MKKIFVYVLLCLGLLASCTSGTEGLDQSEVFTVSLDSIDKDCKGGKAEIVVESLCSWTISDTENVDWFTLSATKGGAGNSVITVDIAENKTPEGKRATIVVGNKLYGFSHKITISQEAGNPFITPSKSQIESTAAGSSMTIDIDSNVEFTASSSESWCKVNPTSLESGMNSVDITIDANPKTESRSAVVTFSNEQYDYSTTISVSQVAFVPNLKIDSEAINATSEGTAKSVAVTSNISWSASCDADWVALTPTNGEKGDSTIKITVAANTKTVAREAVVTISNSEYKIEKQITIAQEAFGPSLNIDTESITASAEGVTKSIAVTSNISWSASCDADWVTITPTNGEKGSSTLKITVAANTKTVAREAVVTISNSEYKIEKQIAIAQEAFGPSLNIDTESITASVEGVTKSIAVTSNISWSASCDADWVTLTPANGEKGNSTLKITVAANTKTVNREAVVTISNSEYKIEKQIAISQEAFGPSLNIDTESITASAEGVTKSIAVTSNISWSASCDADWVTLTPTNGEKGNSTLKITVAANTKTVNREAVVTISNSEYKTEKQIAISQEAFGPSLNVDTESNTASVEGVTKSIAVTSNISWSASCDADWVTLTPTNGEKGNSTLKITVAANTKTVVREAVVTISNSEYKIEKQIAISQEAFGPSLNVDTESITASAEGVTKSIAVTSNISWSASCDADWVTITPTNGEKGSSTLKITVAANIETIAREAVVRISNSEYNLSKEIAVTQAEFIPILEIDAESISISSFGDSQNIAITSNISWGTQCDAEWVSISAEVASVTITATMNEMTEMRTANVRIFNDKYSIHKEITITQDVCPYIEYTSTDGKIVTPYHSNNLGANILSNTYRDGRGIIIFDDEVTVIGANAFSICKTLASITIPDSVTKIGDDTFSQCTSLTSVTIPNSVTEIGSQAFYGCSNLTSITIPNSVTEIVYQTFYGCSSLTSVTIPDSVTEIGSQAFYYCRSLKEIYCKPTTPPMVGDWTFSNNATDRKIYVPASDDDSIINTYKAADGWKVYADYIEEYDFNN